ncbi:hypothetical protein GTN66_00010, partial [bacterium]|nr:hypothetical protein [bacterium]NIO72796.1 hypothetical protein [bacterium]
MEEAEKFILGFLESIPPDSQVYFILGNIYNTQEKYDDTIHYYQKCIELNPYSASA